MNLISQREYEDYLAHHGILGQKWGVRRYQNEDGTLTAAGKSRYRTDGENKSGRVSDRISKEKEKASAYKERVGRIKSMSDSELSARISRLEKEHKLRDLEFDDSYPAVKFVKELLSTSGSAATKKVGTAAAIFGIKTGIEKAFGEDVASSIDKYIKKK